MRARHLTIAVTLAATALAAAPAARADAPPCTTAAARDAVTGSAELVDAIRATGALMGDEQVFDVFGVDKLMCHDLAGGRAAEMAVFLACCTAASPTPFAIFRPVAGEWRLAYRSTRLLISSQRRKGRRIKLRHPVYRRTDPLCCPSSHRRYVVRWRDGAFRRTRR